MLDLQTTTDPSAHYPTCVQNLRSRVQSSPWTQQLTSGLRRNTLSKWQVPRAHLLRIKAKQYQSTDILAIDELEYYSESRGLSHYLPLSARGVLASATDMSLLRKLRDLGWKRPDLVEHCARVLRLNAISAMYRAQVELRDHQKNPPEPLVIPEKTLLPENGTVRKRLDLLRSEVNGRILRQDAQWTHSVYTVALGMPPADAPMVWDIHDPALPAAGLQCIIELPPSKAEPGRDLRWNTLHSESTQPPNPELLDSSRPWKAFVMSGRPAVYTAPTLGMRALEGIYHMLPRLTPACMRIPTLPFGQSPKRGKKNMQKLANAFAHSQEEQPAGEQMVRSLSSQIDIRYRCGTETFVKSVPAYHAEAIFGPSVCAEVLPSLLHAPLPDENSAGSGWRYLGVVALPCTANLATQLHRLCEYAEDI